MECGAIVQEDEFGGLDGLALPGQDPHRVQDLIRLLTQDLNPVNLIERYWIRDIAILTARAEFLRKAHWAVMLRIVERLAARDVEQAGTAREDREAAVAEAKGALELVRSVQRGSDHAAASLDPRWQSLLGEAFMSEIALIDKLTQLEFISEPVSVIAAVGEHPLGLGQTVEQGRCTGLIADLTGRDEEAQRAAAPISHGVQLRIHAALGPVDQALEIPFDH